MDLKQATKEFANPVSWIRVVIGVVLIFGAYKFITRPTQNVRVGQGGVANIYNQQKRFLIPFVEGGVEQQQGRELATYIRAGIRFEF